jgi:hypothetical protein
VRALAATWEQNGGGDGGEAAGDESDGGEEEDEDGSDRRKVEEDSLDSFRGSASGKLGRRGGSAEGRRDLLDGDRIDLDELYGNTDDALRGRGSSYDDSNASGEDEDEYDEEDDYDNDE